MVTPPQGVQKIYVVGMIRKIKSISILDLQHGGLEYVEGQKTQSFRSKKEGWFGEPFFVRVKGEDHSR